MIEIFKKFKLYHSDLHLLLVDDHAVTRQGLRLLLENKLGLSKIDEAENGRHAVKLALKLTPDIVIMEVNMPELNGIDATRQILAELPKTKIIALSRNNDKHLVKEMIKAGASGYLIKSCFFEEIATAIQAVISNRSYLSQKITDIVMKEFATQLTVNDLSTKVVLTTREREVTQLIAEGVKTKDIASKLFVSVKTIEAHRRQVMDKLNINSVAQLTKFALKEGITTLENI